MIGSLKDNHRGNPPPPSATESLLSCQLSSAAVFGTPVLQTDASVSVLIGSRDQDHYCIIRYSVFLKIQTHLAAGGVGDGVGVGDGASR